MMDDYLRKDQILKHFHEHGRFPTDSPLSYKEPPIYLLSGMAAAHTLIVVGVMWLVGLGPILLWGCLIMFSTFIVNTLIGKLLFGYTIESIPFETGVKTIMTTYYEKFVLPKHLKKQKSKSANTQKKSL